MSIVYEKSISSKYRKYCEQISELSKPFSEYSLKTNEFLIRDKSKTKKWDFANDMYPESWTHIYELS